MKPQQNHVDEGNIWHNSFIKLSPSARTCRHEFGYYVRDRICENYFNCADCVIHKNVERLENSRRAHGWREKLPESEVFGLHVPTDRLYHRGHTWVKQETDGTFTVGLDDFGTRLIGKPDSIEFPKVGSEVTVNEPALRLKKRDSTIQILIPVTGKVIDTGDPGKGWYLKIKPTVNGKSTKHLLKGSEVRNWLMKEIERLQTALPNKELGISYSDGGELIEDISASQPDTDWSKIYREIFLQP